MSTRPWDEAKPGSLWEITGSYPSGYAFTAQLAVTLPSYVTPSDGPLFMFVGILAENSAVTPDWITAARPLLLVHRDNPTMPYREDDHVWMEAA